MALQVDPTTDFACLQLAVSQVDLWIAFEDEALDARSTSSLRNLLSAEEQTLADRFHRAHDRRRYVAAHALIRLALSNYFPVAPADWRFGRDRNNQPIIMAPEEFAAVRFSISHTRGLIACLVTRLCEAGVDSERVEPNEELVQIAQDVLSASELESLNELLPENWTARFFDLWTLKEAYGKARGVGLDLPMKAISFDIGSGNSVCVRFDQEIHDDPSRWNFWLRHLPPAHTLSVAIRRDAGKRCEIVERIVRFDVFQDDGECRMSISAAGAFGSVGEQINRNQG
jgi:4'-phosphopantetheinyl transferase